jgi:hypothetical protein
MDPRVDDLEKLLVFCERHGRPDIHVNDGLFVPVAK